MERLTQLKRVIQSLEDQPEAQVPYLREAAQLGDYDSIRTLIHCYTYGDYGLDPDPAQAFACTLLGARLGEGWCQYNAAVCCSQGRGCEPDQQQAARWMKQAAAADVPEAWLPCADMLITREKDFPEARRLIEKAMEGGQEQEARQLLGKLCSEEGSALMEQGLHTQAEAVLRDGAALQNPDCLVSLAYEYSIEDGVGQDMEKTWRCSLQAADLGHPAGMYNVSMCFREGVGTAQDSRKAFEWMKNAAKAEFAEAALPLAQHYHYGLGVHPDDVQALYWVNRALECEEDPDRKVMAEKLKKELEDQQNPAA